MRRKRAQKSRGWKEGEEERVVFLLSLGRYFLTTVFMPDSTSKQSQQSTHNYVKKGRKKSRKSLFPTHTQLRFSSHNNKLLCFKIERKRCMHWMYGGVGEWVRVCKRFKHVWRVFRLTDATGERKQALDRKTRENRKKFVFCAKRRKLVFVLNFLHVYFRNFYLSK